MLGERSEVRAGRRMPGAALLCCALLAAALSPAAASPETKLEAARQHLHDLLDKVERQTAELGTLEERLAAADDKVAAADRHLGTTLAARLRAERALERARTRYEEARARLSDLAVQSFMGVPGDNAGAALVGSMLEATSFADLTDRVAFAESVAEHGELVASEVARARDRLEERVAELDAMAADRTSTVGDRLDAADEHAVAVADQQRLLEELDATRNEIVDLIRRLKERLKGPDLQRVMDAFQGDHHVSYGEWAELFLREMGVPTCGNNLVLVVAWQLQEFTQARWNPLATTHRMPGSTDFNSVGVQNFVSLEQGLDATRETIENGWDIYRYGPIVTSLGRCSDPLVTARAIAASSWCPGCLNGMYVVGVVPRVQDDFETYAAL